MEIITQKEFEEILKKHNHWVNKDCDNWESMRADLSYSHLTGVSLRGADLRGACLVGANLTGACLEDAFLLNANLRGARLVGADLTGACLIGADLRGAKLIGAKLISADLKESKLTVADLRGTNLTGANLIGADLIRAYLIGSDLRGTWLNGADFEGTNLIGADFEGANLKKAKNVTFIPMACPEKGSFIGYKKAHDKIIKLQILEDAKRLSANNRQCRCNKAKVLSISKLDGTPANIDSISSNFDPNFIYTVGEIVEEPNFDDCRWNECSKGIHFFINRQEAVNY